MLLEFFLFYFNKICDIFLNKVQQSYCYTQFCNYREEFEFKPISSEFNIVLDTSFSSLILHAVNLLLWKKILSLTLLRIITVCTDQAPSSEFSLLRDQDVTLRERILGKMGGGGGDSPCKTPSLNFALLLDITHTKKLSPPVPPLITDQILEKKMSLIAFRQILPTILPAAYTFSSTIMTNLEMFIGNKSLNVKHCPVELSHRITPLNLYGKPWEEGRIPPNSQIFTHFPYQKIP